MSHNYNTPPLSASHHLHFAMCTDHRRIYGHVFSKSLTFQTLQNTFSDSTWSTPVHHVKSILIDPITNLNLVLANTATAPLHAQTTCPTSSALVRCCVSCLPHASSLSPRRASAILAKIYQVANPHHLRPHCRSISHTRPMSSSTPPPNHELQPESRASRLPADRF
jgi:hypothetical protein